MWGKHSDYGIIERSGRRVTVTLWLCLLPSVLLAGAWRLGGVSALEDDLIYYLPIRQFIGEQLAQGLLPLWNPYVNLGTSVAADPQAGLWYPPTWLFALLPPLWAYGLNVLGHFVLAGSGMYRFLRARGLDERACLLGALAFEFSGFLVAHRVHLAMFQAAAWLPWVLLGWVRFARSGKRRHFALVCLAMGLQLLVQHTQISVIGFAVLAAYVAVVLWPQRRSLWWQFPIGVSVAALLSAVQTLPTLAAFAGTTRSLPAYHLFVENSWAPLSAVMLLFPMFFGARTPSLWTQPWWGVSHFCEQWAYPTLVILLLAACSLALLRQREDRGSDEWRQLHPPGRRREVAFWWLAMLGALVLALGGFTPVSEWLFQVPFYRSLRVPARWILVWSLALPILAAFVVSALHRHERVGQPIHAMVRRLARWGVPAAVLLVLGFLVYLRLRADALEASWSGYRSAEFWNGLREAVWPDNPALLLPLVLLAVSTWAVYRWAERTRGESFEHSVPRAAAGGLYSPRPASRSNAWTCMLGLFVVDLAWTVPFVDVVDARTLTRHNLQQPPPLAGALHKLGAGPGDRLLVPRFAADYVSPLEVLWPQSNINHGIATLNGYGPLGSAAQRLLLGFAAWGSSEHVVDLLRNPGLCRMLGLRFVATRSGREREVFSASLWPESGPGLQTVRAATRFPVPVRAGQDILWWIDAVGGDGLWELRLEVEAMPGESGRCFIRLENDDGEGVGPTLSVEPADLAVSPRTLRLLFPLFEKDISRAGAATRVRIKADRGEPMVIRSAKFGSIASAVLVWPEQTALWSDHGPLADGISLYELHGSAALWRWAERVEAVDGLGEIIERLTCRAEAWQRWALVENEQIAAAVGREPVTGNIAVHTQTRTTLAEATIEAPQTQLLIFGENWDPGWRVSIDGHSAEVTRVNGLLMGVAVPAGRHDVVFTYWPRGLTLGLSLSGVALLVCLALLVRR